MTSTMFIKNVQLEQACQSFYNDTDLNVHTLSHFSKIHPTFLVILQIYAKTNNKRDRAATVLFLIGQLHADT